MTIYESEYIVRPTDHASSSLLTPDMNPVSTSGVYVSLDIAFDYMSAQIIDQRLTSIRYTTVCKGKQATIS
jgi:hypothetical protein